MTKVPRWGRALYLGNTVYRIHGTNQPSTIGHFVSSGCIRFTNEDVEDLYNRVSVGTRGVVLPNSRPVSASAPVVSGTPLTRGDAEQERSARSYIFYWPASWGPFMTITLKSCLSNVCDFERDVASSVVVPFPERSARVALRPCKTSSKLAQLEQENTDLRRYVVDLALQIQDLKDLLRE